MLRAADAVVVGGGITGAAVSYHLSRFGMKVVVCEKETFCNGATGRCGAGVREQWGQADNCRLAQAAINIFEHLQEELDYERDIEFKQKGYLMMAHTEKEWAQFQKNVRLQNSLGIPSKLLTPAEAREIVPSLNTEGMFGATYNRRDGHANPFLTTKAYLWAAERNGAEVSYFTDVTGIDVSGGRVRGVRTSAGDIDTPAVINAAGPWAAQVGAMAGVDLPLYTQRHQILVTEPVGSLLDPMLMSFSLGIYGQQTPHGSLVMGMGDSKEPRGYDTGHSWSFLHAMCSIMTRLLPVLRDVRVVRQWSGLYTMTPDAHPILGSAPGVEGYYQAVGFSGHGFMLAPIVGQLIAEMAAGRPLTMDISRLDMGRFTRGEFNVEPSVV